MTAFRSDSNPKTPPDSSRERSRVDFGAGFTVACPEVVAAFESDGAIGVILVDASPLLRVEEVAGPPAFRRAFEGLGERIRVAAERVIGESIRVTAGLGDDAQILVFIHRSRDEGAFYAESLPAGARELRRLIERQVRRVAYPYLTGPVELAVGHAFALWRPFQRPESQLRRLLETALACARFERERLRRKTRAEFERILLEKRIECHYEPIVQLKDLTVIGYEGLARGPVDSPLRYPTALFDTAEIVGLDYELDSLCRQLALQGARDLTRDTKLFINCLPASVHDPLFQPARIREALGALGLAPADLVLEISERQAITSYAVFRDAIATFTAMGFGIAVDDMGAGYSSLATALELRPGFLKIDRSLITGIDGDPPRQELVRAIQVLAKRTGAVVVAEGIENEAELEALSDLGVDCGQGYLFGRGGPLPGGIEEEREDWTTPPTPQPETGTPSGTPQDTPSGPSPEDPPADDVGHTLGRLRLWRTALARLPGVREKGVQSVTAAESYGTRETETEAGAETQTETAAATDSDPPTPSSSSDPE
jgi:EAL domain-containing protein (putative c-di-GMP-specific phosphodiesterase class I)